MKMKIYKLLPHVKHKIRIYLSMWLHPHRHVIKQISLKLIFLAQFSFAVNEEHYVLFRGVHFSTEKPIPAIPPAPQIVYSPYSEKPHNRTQDIEKKRALETLKYIFSHRLPNGMSAYDWIQDFYVNNYKQFKLDCANPNSMLRQLLMTQPALRDINESFLVSTTFSAPKALQYAAGMCGATNRRLPIENVNWVLQLTNPIIGYVDVFFIPANQIAGGNPYFVLEEFIKHNITIPHKHWAQNYTHQEEVNFPFYIPAQFHRARIMVDVRPFGLPPRNPARWGNDAWLREKFKQMETQLELRVNAQLEQMQDVRAFLGPLAYQLNARTYRLNPTEAIANRNAIAQQIPVLRNQAQERQGTRHEFLLYAEPFRYLVIINFPFNFASVYALQNIAKTQYLDLGHLDYSFRAYNAALLVPLLESSNVIRIALARAPAKTISVQEEMYHRNVCSTQIAFFQKVKNYLQDVWIDTNPAILETILNAIRKRRTPLSIIMPNEILAPRTQHLLLEAFVTVSADIRQVHYLHGTFSLLQAFLTHYIAALCQDLDCMPAEIDLNSVPDLSDAFMVNEAIYYLQPRF